MKYIPLRGKYGIHKKCIVDDDIHNEISKHKWYANNDGYAIKASWEKERKKKGITFMHRLINKTPQGFETDHINSNRLDNRRSNLRSVFGYENSKNKKIYKSNKSGYKGVLFYLGRYICRIQVNNKMIYIGSFRTAIDGALAYNEAAKKLHGKFARLNEVKHGRNG